MSINETPTFQLTAVVLDCPDAAQLAEFYGKLLGWKVQTSPDGEWAAVKGDNSPIVIYFQTEPDYVAPVWPTVAGKPQQMTHLDFTVSDLEKAVEYAVSLGAKVSEAQFFDTVKVCFDPAGHPFCLCQHG